MYYERATGLVNLFLSKEDKHPNIFVKIGLLLSDIDRMSYLIYMKFFNNVMSEDKLKFKILIWKKFLIFATTVFMIKSYD